MSLVARIFLLFALTGFAPCASGQGELPKGAFTVFSVDSTNKARFHGVDVQSIIDDDQAFVQLSGPTHIAACDKFDSKLPGFLAWYSIRKPVGPERTVKLSTAKGAIAKVVIKQAEFLLCPAQKLTDGAPPEIPEKLNIMLAFQVAESDADIFNQMVKESKMPVKPRIGKAKFVCLAAQQWHHEEHVGIKDASAAFVAFEIPQKKQSAKSSAIDQFGLHGTTLVASDYVLVPVVVEQ